MNEGSSSEQSSDEPSTLRGRGPTNGIVELDAFLTTLAAARNKFLVVIGLTYAVGYAVWGYYGYRNGLGLLPALSFQYFIAGIPMTVSVAAVWIAVRARRTPEGYFRGNRVLGVPFVMLRTLVILAWITILVGVFVAFAPLEWNVFPAWLAPVCLLIGSLLLGLITYAVQGSKHLEPAAKDRSVLWNADPRVIRDLGHRHHHVTWPVASLILFTLVFVSWVYPAIPQEMGGVRPRCVQLDLKLDSLSPQTLEQLSIEGKLSPPTGELGGDVIRSKTLHLLVSPAGMINVRTREPNSGVASLDREAVVAIHHC